MKRHYQISMAATLCLFLLVAAKRQVDRSPSTVSPRVHINSVDIKSIVPEKLEDNSPSAEINNQSVKLVPAESIPLDFVTGGQYLSKIKFDRDGNIYLKLYAPPNQAYLVKFDPNRREHRKLDIPGLQPNESLESFAIDDSNNLYTSVSSRDRKGAILILSAEGDLVLRIDTGDFISSRLAIDALGRIWAAGQLLAGSREEGILQDVQLRVYERDGHLVGIPMRNLDPADSQRSLLTVEDDKVRFISHAISAVFNFSDTNSIDAREYPFKHLTDLGQLKVVTKSLQERRLLVGAGRLGRWRIWCGSIDHGTGVYDESFVGVTDSAGRAVTPEIKLPAEYRSLAGIDNGGNLYAYTGTNDQTALTKLKILISKKASAKRGKLTRP